MGIYQNTENRGSHRIATHHLPSLATLGASSPASAGRGWAWPVHVLLLLMPVIVQPEEDHIIKEAVKLSRFLQELTTGSIATIIRLNCHYQMISRPIIT